MRVAVISIGNSKGIRFSKTILEKYNITDSVDLIMEEEHIIIKPKSAPRTGWEKAFRKLHEQGEDNLLIPDVFKDENLD